MSLIWPLDVHYEDESEAGCWFPTCKTYRTIWLDGDVRSKDGYKPGHNPIRMCETHEIMVRMNYAAPEKP